MSFPVALALAAGIVTQLLGVFLATGPDPSWPTVIVLVLAGLALGGTPLLRQAGRATPIAARRRFHAQLGFNPADAAIVLTMGTFFPVAGLAGLGLVLFLRGARGPRRGDNPLIETEAPRLSGSPLNADQAGRFGPGSLEGILRHSPSPDLRMRVVLACRQLPGRLAVPLLRLALRDPVDDVRLLAYAVLDQSEQKIQLEMQSLLKRAGLKDADDPRMPVSVHAKLAELHFELVYQGLVEGELLAFALDNVRKHARAALDASPAMPRMALLAARALIIRRRFDDARGMLHEALKRGLSFEVVGPFLAEVDYELRRPEEVRRQVAGFAESARLRPLLAEIVERWS